MERTRSMRMAAVVAVLSLGLTACPDGEEPDEDGFAPGPGTPTPTEEVEVTGRGDGQLTIGRVLPESGFLDYLGESMINATEMAVEDINEAGGVLGRDVRLLEEDSGTDPTVAGPNVNSLLASGSDVIVGAAASGVTLSFLDVLFQNQIVNCSPSATSPEFLTQPNAAFMFRTVAPDDAVAPVIADEIVTRDGHSSVVIVNRSDSYGQSLADLVQEELEALNAEVLATVEYTEEEQTFDTQVNTVTENDPDAVVLIAFREGATFLRRLAETDFDVSAVYGADGVFSGRLPEFAAGEGGDVSILDGMKVIGASGSQDFNERLNEFLPEEAKSEFIYGGQSYDCVTILALAAEQAQTDDSSQFADLILDITRGGEKCTDFASCKQLLDDGQDIDYDGASGEIELREPAGEGNLGNPTVTTYAVARYEDGELTPVRSERVDLDIGATPTPQ
ncbi:MAG: ABC transporter substrate-binding protein [Actinobacteria bacterium]|nr:ABC transporter substrate-binding protein [Actinomycetota bacterium]